MALWKKNIFTKPVNSTWQHQHLQMQVLTLDWTCAMLKQGMKDKATYSRNSTKISWQEGKKILCLQKLKHTEKKITESQKMNEPVLRPFYTQKWVQVVSLLWIWLTWKPSQSSPGSVIDKNNILLILVLGNYNSLQSPTLLTRDETKGVHQKRGKLASKEDHCPWLQPRNPHGCKIQLAPTEGEHQYQLELTF